MIRASFSIVRRGCLHDSKNSATYCFMSKRRLVCPAAGSCFSSASSRWKTEAIPRLGEAAPGASIAKSQIRCHAPEQGSQPAPKDWLKAPKAGWEPGRRGRQSPGPPKNKAWASVSRRPEGSGSGKSKVNLCRSQL